MIKLQLAETTRWLAFVTHFMSAAKRVQSVLCGLPGDVEHKSDAKDHNFAKVGGQAAFPGASPPSELVENGFICANCSKRLLLVVQVSIFNQAQQCSKLTCPALD